jgi:beta-glucosidase
MKNAGLDPRIETLLAAMSLDQKIGQMTQGERAFVGPDEVAAFQLGSVLSGAGSAPGDNTLSDWVEMCDAYWAASTRGDAGRVPVPLLYAVDAVHGNANVRGATVFPHNIGLGAAHDPALVARVARATAREVRAAGVDWTFAPALSVARDLRWGRTYESFSEDAGLVSSYAGGIVAGLQGDLGTDGVVACAKHWVGDGGTAEGADQGDTRLPEPELEAIHVAPYREAIGAGVLTVMASFSRWNGVRCHANRYLLTEVLRGRLGFEGLVVSDWDAAAQLADDYDEAVVIAANAGIDLFMVTEKWKETIEALRRAVETGAVPPARIDGAVRRILRVKAACGLFDAPRPSDRPGAGSESFGGPEHRALAREAASKSLVLLKNQDGVLPLRRDARILVAGKNADDRGAQCGGFTVEWQGVSGNERIEGGTSIWEGIRAVAPNARLLRDGAGDRETWDVAVVVVGERPYAEGMGDIRRSGETPRGSSPGRTTTLRPYGDTLELARLHPEDLATIRRISERGIPVVAILVSGRPLVVGPELAASHAFVAAWLPGSEGAGVADVLFGDHDFVGRLSFSWPAGAECASRGAGLAPLFPRGYGLRFRG